MGLLRGIARTAVVAGTATAVSNRVSRRQAGRWAAKDQQADDERQAQYVEQHPQYAPAPPQYVAPPPQVDPAQATTDRLSQLQQLGELKATGVLTQAEFDAQKARILAG